MFREYLNSKDFSISEFVQELDKKELLLLLFITSKRDKDEILETMSMTEDVDDFYKTVQKVIGSGVRKFPSKDMANQLEKFLTAVVPTEALYASVYDYNATLSFRIFDSPTLAIEEFINLLFLSKIKKIMDSKRKKIRFSTETIRETFLFNNRPIINTLGITLLLGKIELATKQLDSPEFASDLREFLIVLFMEQYLDIEQAKRVEVEQLANKQELDLQKKSKDLNKKDELFKKAKEQANTLSKQLEQTEKVLNKQIQEVRNKTEEESEKRFQKVIEALENEVSQLKIDKLQYSLDEKKRDEETISGLNMQVSQLTDSKNDLLQQVSDYKRKLLVLESKRIVTIVKEYLEDNEPSEELKELISNHSEELERKKTKNGEINSQYPDRLEQKVGYCLIENNIHYAVFGDSSKLEIKEIPESLYIGNYQFVKVDITGKFKYIFKFKFFPSDQDYQIAEFGSVVNRDNKPFMIKAVWDERKIENVPSHVFLRESQVISVNARGELVRFYGSVHHNADNYMPSILAKGQEAYYVLKVFPNGLMVRSIETGEEHFKSFDVKDFPIQEQNIVCTKENDVIKVYVSPRFYTYSSYYKKAQTGIADVHDDQVFIKKMTGEVVIVNEIPPQVTVADGEVLVVDENENFIQIRKDLSNKTTVERKKLDTFKPGGYKKQYEKIEIEAEVLIVGKITYENSYKMAFLKSGYKTQVIDGYEPWSKVKSALKDKDVVVGITDFISHDNMWKLKDEVSDIPLLFPEHDGANRILEAVENTLNKNKQSEKGE